MGPVRVLAAALLVAAAPVDDLLAALQRAVARDDRKAVAALIQYPITVTAGDVRIPVRDAAALVQSYDAVFTPELKAAIRSGSAIRKGLIRVRTVQGVEKVAGITLPEATAGRGTSGAPRRIVLGAPERPAQLSGSLAPAGSDTYVAYVEKGRLLDARIQGVRGRDIVLKVLDAKTGKPVDAKAAAGARVWTGRAPESADYHIEVTRAARTGSASMPYVLIVRQR